MEAPTPVEVRLPLRDASRLTLGSVVYVSGVVVTMRDRAHRRVAQGAKPPIDVEGLAIYHCGPIVRKTPRGYEVVSAGPTTSARMSGFLDKVLEATKAKLVIGKGGLTREGVEAIRRHRAAYLAFPGGCGALAASKVKRVLGAYWLEELGPAEAVWVLEVERLGPMVVAIDSNGRSLYKALE